MREMGGDVETAAPNTLARSECHMCMNRSGIVRRSTSHLNRATHQRCRSRGRGVRKARAAPQRKRRLLTPGVAFLNTEVCDQLLAGRVEEGIALHRPSERRSLEWRLSGVVHTPSFILPMGPLRSRTPRPWDTAWRCAFSVLAPLCPLLDAIRPVPPSGAAVPLANFDATFPILPADCLVSVNALPTSSSTL